MKRLLLLFSIPASLFLSISAAALDLESHVEDAACAGIVIDEVELPPADHPDHEASGRALLNEIDHAYADLLAAEFARSTARRSGETQCLLDRYRARARELEPLRVATRRTYEQAAAELGSEEQIASSLCLPYAFASRDWKKCERAAAAQRARLRARLRSAKDAWDRIDSPPDYASDDGSAYWVTAEVARNRITAMAGFDRSIEPRHTGPEVWCGDANLRRAETLLSPESEYMRVTEGIASAERNLQNYAERYAQAYELEREAVERLDRPIRTRAFARQLAKLNEIRSALENWRCQADWNVSRAHALSSVPDAAALAYREAKDAFDRLETQCDTHRPREKNWTLAGIDSEAWIGCLKSLQAQREEELHRLETKRSLHEATRAAASEYARNALH